ncbi:MAG: molybdenum cofactor guanylyltransferase [Desulfovibrionaceae bacterium]|nr:molybdenum cofactor guanylyltransferase [Desulfovibrionaceae bacterium]
MASKRLLGGLLCGGLSQRLGQDKALVRLAGKTLLERSYSLLVKSVEPSFLLTRKGQEYRGFPCLTEEGARIGPIGAIAHALNYAKEYDFTALLVLACDLPFITKEWLDKLKESYLKDLDNHLAFVFKRAESKKVENLVAIYRVGALPYFLKSIENKEYAVGAAIPKDLQKRLSYQKEESLAFHNLNTLDDLKLAQEFLKA